MAKLKARRFPSALVPFVLELVRRSGHDATALEKKYLKAGRSSAGLPEVSLPELDALLEEAARVAEDPLFGLHCALAMPRGGYGLLEFGIRAAPTGRIALEQLAKFGALINPLVRWSLEAGDGEVSLHHRSPRKGGLGPQANIFTVARIVQISREMLGAELTPVRVWFAHKVKACPPELAAFLGTSAIHFGHTSNGVAFTEASLARAPAGADPELNRALERHGAEVMEQCGLTTDDVVERTRRAVVELLPKGEVSLQAAAKRLHVTARTLQRRLREDGVGFKALVTEVRREQAERLLSRSDAKVGEVAQRLGFADAGVFARAFRTWTGASPAAWRERQAEAG